MTYVERIVSRDPDENIVYRAFISIWSLLPNFLLGSAFLVLSIFSLMKLDSLGFGNFTIPAMIGFAVIGALVLAHAVAKFYTTEIAITNKHLITKPGIISRNGTQLMIAKCESCNLKQSVLGRILNYGSIVVSGAGDTNAVIPGISNPLKFQDVYAHCYRSVENR